MSVIVELGKKRAWINSKLKIVSFHEIDGWNLYTEESELRFKEGDAFMIGIYFSGT